MTHLIVPVSGDSIADIRADIAAAAEAGADMVELRLDMITDVSDEELDALHTSPAADLPIILTFRSEAEGGDVPATDAERLERLERLGPIAQFVDVEWATWDRSETNRKRVETAIRRAGIVSQSGGLEVIEQGHRRALILSRHDLKGRPASLQSDLLAMVGTEDCSIPKLAWRARTVRDNFEAFELHRLSPRPMIALCMGTDGLLSRVLAKKFGAFGTFAALRSGLESAPGQPTIGDVVDLYRWKRIDAKTAVYGVIGDPVAHSLSPHVHNAAFETHGINAVYLPLRVDAGYEPFKAFMVEVLARPWMDFAGLSVTIPHKENAFRFLNESGRAMDDSARAVGAVNTIRIRPGGVVDGINTDLPGVLAAVEDTAFRPSDGWRGRRAAVLGAGGVARAMVAALKSLGMDVTVFNRTREKGEKLAATLGCRAGAWEQRDASKSDLIVNCTSVGMAPNSGESPFPAASLGAHQQVFDTVYNPLQTILLNAAAGKGCRVMDGLTFFAHQARLQFHHWTGNDGSFSANRECARHALSARKAQPDESA